MSTKETKRWLVDKDVQKKRSKAYIQEAALWIKKGQVIAFPTETVYGLGANALDEEAVKRIFMAKGRPSDNPLIVHIAKKEQVSTLVTDISEKAHILMDAFWPGPLTLIFPHNGTVAQNVTAQLQTIAIRMPDHPVAQALLLLADVPVAAPSANLSGKPSPTTATHVWDDLQGKIFGIVDGGQTGVGLESTVLDCSTSPPTLYRPGGVSKEEIERLIGPIQVHTSIKKENAPASPGLKYTHYAPQAPLYVCTDREHMALMIEKAKERKRRIGLLLTAENRHMFDADVIVVAGKKDNLAEVAHNLYDCLRTFDEEQVDIIFAQSFSKRGIGAAVMNRLEKAASPTPFV